jgi:phosphoglycolate phosphatase
MQQMQIIFPEKDNKFWQDAAEHYRTIYSAKLLQYAPLFPDTVTVLQSLKKAGVEMTIVSSRLSDQINCVLEHAEILSFFALVLGADDVLNHKPHPEAVLLTLKELSIQREDAIVIGDSIYDMDMARNAEVAAIGVTTGVHSREILATANPQFIVDRLEAILPILTESGICTLSGQHAE